MGADAAKTLWTVNIQRDISKDLQSEFVKEVVREYPGLYG